MSRWIGIGVLALASMGCGDSSESTGASESAQTAPDEATEGEGEVAEAAAEAAEAAAAEGADERRHDLDGLAVDIADDGTIVLTGADRWGGELDTTYASLEYFTNAVPVLKRSISEEQGAALEALAAELNAAEGTGAAEGPTSEAAQGAAGGGEGE